MMHQWPEHEDHYEPVSALEDHDIAYDEADVLIVEGERVVPMRCHDCGAPAHYDYSTDNYRHDDPRIGCFLIPAREEA